MPIEQYLFFSIQVPKSYKGISSPTAFTKKENFKRILHVNQDTDKNLIELNNILRVTKVTGKDIRNAPVNEKYYNTTELKCPLS